MTQKILMVEDNSDLSQLLAFYLNNAGYENSRARNLTQGISKALAERPDLIITDLYLPDMTAVEATVLLKQDPATSGIPIIVLTAVIVGEWKTKALKAGVAKNIFNYPHPSPRLDRGSTYTYSSAFLSNEDVSLSSLWLTKNTLTSS